MNLAIGTPGPLELIIILVVVLLLFGAKRLPELSKSLGRSLSEFKKGREEGLSGAPVADKKLEAEKTEKKQVAESTDDSGENIS
jgi:sec-independent protein translocase protein TatA